MTRAQMADYELHGPRLQVAMLERGDGPDGEAVETIAGRVRALFAEYSA